MALSLAFRCLHFFRFDVNCLSNFLEGARLQAAVARDVGDDLQFLPVGIGLDGGVEEGGRSAPLNLKGSCDKEKLRVQAANPGRTAGLRNMRRPLQTPLLRQATRRRDATGRTGDHTERVSHGGPQYGLAACFEVEGGGLAGVGIPFIGYRHRGRGALAKPGKTPALFPDQVHNAFQMVGLRKQVHQV